MSAPSEPAPSPLGDTGGFTVEQASRTGALRAPAHTTRPRVLVTGCIVVLLALAFWRPLQRKCTAYFLLQSEAPAEEVLAEAVEQANDLGVMLSRLWHTHRLPHRQFVVSYLGRLASSKPDVFGKLEPLLLEATSDPDAEVRQTAFATLERLKHTQLRRLALEQLSDADPAVRLLGLQGLRSIATSNDVPVAMRLLKDPEPRVVVAAALVLRQATGQDFGIKLADALPQFTCIDTNPPPAPNLEAIRQGVERWEQWWTAHQSEYQQLDLPPISQRTSISLPTQDFKLQDCGGSPRHLAQFHGKSVLLVLWSPGAPASLNDAPALNALHERNSAHLAILGICIPAAPSCCDEHQHGNGQGHEHAHHHHTEPSGTSPGPPEFRALAQQTADRLKIRFPILVDPEGTIGARFRANELPVYVLLDAQGMLRRRLVGFRTEAALAAMINKL